MITISRVRNVSSAYLVPVGNVSWGFSNGNASTVECGGPLFLNSTSKSNMFDQLEIDVFDIVQGKTEMGRLRDKAVWHCHADGDVTVSGYWSGGTAFVPTTTSLGGCGKNFTISGYGPYLANSFVIWGKDHTASYDFVMPSLYDSVNKKWLKPVHLTVQINVRFRGDLCVYTIQRFHSGNVWTDGSVCSPPAWSTYGYFFYRKPDMAIYRSSPFGGSSFASPDFDITFSKGKCQNRETALLDAYPQLGLPCTSVMMMYTISGSAVEGSVLDQYRVAGYLESQDFLNFCNDSLAWAAKEEEDRRDPSTPSVWHTLATQILAQQKFTDVNTFLMVVDAANLWQSASSWESFDALMRHLRTSYGSISQFLASLPEKYKGPVGLARFIADKGLGVMYGVLPTARDLSGLYRATDQLHKAYHGNNRYHSRNTSILDYVGDSPVFSTKVLTAEVSKLPRDFLGQTTGLVRNLDSVGIWPTVSAAYDMIPFSFCLDWLIDVGGKVRNIDDQIWEQYYPIDYLIYSDKRSWRFPVSRLKPLDFPGVSGSVTYSVYDRWLSRGGFLPISSTEIDAGSSLLRHWAEGSMLIVQRIPRKRG